MSLLNITDFQQNDPATPNAFNSRFGKIVSLVNGNLDSTNISDKGITRAKIADDLFETIYPIGSIYMNSQSSTNPATLFGFGTWEAFGAGKVPVGFNSSDSDFNAAEKTGGEKTHTLTSSEMPSHTHTVPGGWGSGPTDNGRFRVDSNSPLTSWGSVTSTGGGVAHNNLQPYITVYMWKRTG